MWAYATATAGINHPKLFDKMAKIALDAIHKLGGIFLVLDEQTGIYTDTPLLLLEIKTTEKTNQALRDREGQAQFQKDKDK